MSNPLAMKSVPIGSSELDSFVSLKEMKEVKQRHKTYATDPEALKGAILRSRVDVEFVPSVMIPLELIQDEHTLKLSQSGGHVASAKMGPVALRLRTRLSTQLVSLVAKQLEGNKVLYDKVVGSCRSSVYASSGALGAFGRFLKYAPKFGGMKDVIVPTMSETSQAMFGCGIANTREITIDPLSVGNDGTPGILVASKSSLGYPTCSDTNNARAVSIHQEYAQDMLLKLQDVEDYDEAKVILDADKKEHPYKYIFMGKAKADAYKIEKVLNDEMRWYCVVPFWIRAILSSVIQALESRSENIITSDEENERSVVHIASKMSFAFGGAMKLVLKLQKQLDRFGYAFANNGDDTIIALRVGKLIVVVSVDMSSFDLTQLAEVMKPLRRKVFERLHYIDPSAAYVYRYVKEEPKTVAAFSIGTLKMKHSSPSGMPGVSLENGLLANVVCQRIVSSWKKGEGSFKDCGLDEKEKVEQWISGIVKNAGESLGLVSRIDEMESCSYEKVFVNKDGGSVELRGLLRFLSEFPFLFLGFRLFCDANGAVICYQDLPRSMTNLIYPSKMYIVDQTLFKLYNMMRILGSLVNLGFYPQSTIGSSALFDVGCDHLPIVNGTMVPLYDIMKVFIRGYMDVHCQSLLDMHLSDSVTSSVNPFTGLDFGSTLRSMLGSLDKEYFYPFSDPNALLWGVGLHSFKDELTEADVRDYSLGAQPTGSWVNDQPGVSAGDVLTVVSTMRPVKIDIKKDVAKRGWMDPKADFFGKKPPLIGVTPSLKMIAGHTVRSVLAKGKTIAGLRRQHSFYSEEECESVYSESIGQVDSEYFGRSEDGDYRDNWSEDDDEDYERNREEEKEWIKQRAVELEGYYTNLSVND